MHMMIEQITNAAGQLLTTSDEPVAGSVALTHGETGTAWQRRHSDGLWHRAGGGRPRPWIWMLTQRNLVLVYEPKENR